uniref:Uncharacterized protein n=2 Tax=Schistocephalus solidus TaxID=70667 RepID=A0A0X3NH79_SCHSO
MAIWYITIASLCLATLKAQSQKNELTIIRKPGTQLSNDTVHIDFVARAVVGQCKPSERVCGRIGGHAGQITICSGTRLPERTDMINVYSASGNISSIVVNDYELRNGETLLGHLTVNNHVVEKGGTFVVPFLITDIYPENVTESVKNKTIILLNGQMGIESVDLQFAEEEDENGNTFTLKILPGTAVTNKFTFYPIFIVSTMLLTEL